jgi:hypothetical protein
MPRADAVARRADLDELREIVTAHGLEHRLADVERLARSSARLGVGELAGHARSRFGGRPDLPAEIEWPQWGGRELTFLLQVSLAQLAAAGFDSSLPRTGTLFLFYARPERPTGLSPEERGSCVALVGQAEPDPEFEVEPPDVPGTVARELQISVQLAIPRVWAAPVMALNLDEREQGQWEDVRAELAQLQGLDLDEPAPGTRCLHRLGGYPDDTRGGMPALCERVSAGVELDDELAAQSWCLLLQLSADDLLGWKWGESTRERLYVWLRNGAVASDGPLDIWALRR